MSRRRAPRPLRSALEAATPEIAPQTTLARVQACWPEAVGAVIAGQAWPLAERDGRLTVGCRSATWASELELLAPELLGKLNAALGGGEQAPLADLRAKVTQAP